MLASILITAAMLFVSERDNFWDTDIIAENTQFGEVDAAGNTKVLYDPQVDEAFEGMKGKKVLILVHGFDNPQPTPYYYTIQANIQNANTPPYDQIIGYIWPCFGGRSDYFEAKGNVASINGRFKSLLMKLQPLAEQVDVVAHSMGNVLVLESLKFQKDPYSKNLISNFFSMAPAVDNESIERNEVFFPSTQNCDNMFVFYSRRDGVLKWAYPVPELDKALGCEGSENPQLLPENVQMIDCSAVIDSHAAYLYSRPVFSYVQHLELDKLLGPFYVKDVEITTDGSFKIIKKSVVHSTN